MTQDIKVREEQVDCASLGKPEIKRKVLMVWLRRLLAVAAVALGMIVVFLGGVVVGNVKRLSLVSTRYDWAIAIYSGDSPFDLHPAAGVPCPVITARDVTDLDAEYVADPFMVMEGNTWYMFFEVVERASGDINIAVATSSEGLRWTYKQIVLDEPFILSYPQVFKWNREYYMVPESAGSHAIRLYKATDFPTQWKHVQNLMEGVFADPTLFRFDDTWWLFATRYPGLFSELRLYYATELTGEWTEHPKSPIYAHNPDGARCGGRIVAVDGRLFRLGQDDHPHYGNALRAFEIKALSRTDYQETEAEGSPILAAAGRGWNASGMHTADLHQVDGRRWLACVDGYRRTLSVRIPLVGLNIPVKRK